MIVTLYLRASMASELIVLADILLRPLSPVCHLLLLLVRHSSAIAEEMIVPSSGSLPRFGLGMAALGRPGYINLDRSSILGSERSIEKMQSQANEVIEQLLLLSKSSSFIPWLDCARSYGLSEKFVGEYLRSHEIPPEDVYVSSKWGYSKFSVYSGSMAAMSLHPESTN